MNETSISWTEWKDREGNTQKGYTWNPVTGCSKVSPGCKNCYAEAWSHRWNRSFEVTLHPDKLNEVKKIPSGAKVFVNSMSDMFHDKVSASFINQVMTAIESRPDVTFQILTKRPANAMNYSMLYNFVMGSGFKLFPNNLWLGVSVEMAEYTDRIDILRRIPVKTRFISFEPLIGDIGEVDLRRIDQILIGGESGPHHRPMKIEWARNLVKQAKEQGVAVWMKQLGGFRPGGNLEDFPEDLRLREFPEGGM